MDSFLMNLYTHFIKKVRSFSSYVLRQSRTITEELNIFNMNEEL